MDKFLLYHTSLKGEHDSSFFICYVAPPKHVQRSASKSSACCKGLSLTETAKAARWTNFATFAKFYDKPVNDINFGSNILNGVYITL